MAGVLTAVAVTIVVTACVPDAADGPGGGGPVGPVAEAAMPDPCELLDASGLVGTLVTVGTPYEGGALAPQQLAGCNASSAEGGPIASVGVFVAERSYFDTLAAIAAPPAEGADNDYVVFTSPELGDEIVFSGYRAGWTDADEEVTAEAGEYVIAAGDFAVSLNFAVPGGQAPVMRAAAIAIAESLG